MPVARSSASSASPTSSASTPSSTRARTTCYDNCPDDDEARAVPRHARPGSHRSSSKRAPWATRWTKKGFYQRTKERDEKGRRITLARELEDRRVRAPRTYPKLASSHQGEGALLQGRQRRPRCCRRCSEARTRPARSWPGPVTAELPHLHREAHPRDRRRHRRTSTVAMRWGFNWDLGPFESWDAIGVGESVAAQMKDAGPHGAGMGGSRCSPPAARASTPGLRTASADLLVRRGAGVAKLPLPESEGWLWVARTSRRHQWRGQEERLRGALSTSATGCLLL